MMLVDGTVVAAAAGVSQVAADGPLEEALTSLACVLPVVLSGTLVPAHDALDARRLATAHVAAGSGSRRDASGAARRRRRRRVVVVVVVVMVRDVALVLLLVLLMLLVLVVVVVVGGSGGGVKTRRKCHHGRLLSVAAAATCAAPHQLIADADGGVPDRRGADGRSSDDGHHRFR